MSEVMTSIKEIEEIEEIEKIEKMGYRLCGCKDFTYKSKLSDREKEFAARFGKRAMKNATFFICILILSSIAVCVAAAVLPVDFDPPAMRYIIPVFIVPISVLMILLVIARAKGPKKVAYVKVIAKTWRRSHTHSSSNIIYSLVAYQSVPHKLYAKNIHVDKETYEKVCNGDIVIIVSNILDNQAYLCN